MTGDGPLPRYAGLNTPSWALLNGEPEHGVTWHKMTRGADRAPAPGTLIATSPGVAAFLAFLAHLQGVDGFCVPVEQSPLPPPGRPVLGLVREIASRLATAAAPRGPPLTPDLFLRYPDLAGVPRDAEGPLLPVPTLPTADPPRGPVAPGETCCPRWPVRPTFAP